MFKWDLKFYISIQFKVKHFKLRSKLNNWIIFFFLIIYITPLYLAIERENIEILKFLLMNDKIDINKPYIIIYVILYNFKFTNSIIFKILSFNTIQNYILKWYSKFYL